MNLLKDSKFEFHQHDDGTVTFTITPLEAQLKQKLENIEIKEDHPINITRSDYIEKVKQNIYDYKKKESLTNIENNTTHEVYLNLVLYLKFNRMMRNHTLF
jgi:hypothetical protein